MYLQGRRWLGGAEAELEVQEMCQGTVTTVEGPQDEAAAQCGPGTVTGERKGGWAAGGTAAQR